MEGFKKKKKRACIKLSQQSGAECFHYQELGGEKS
jgi:hypothetical protein